MRVSEVDCLHRAGALARVVRHDTVLTVAVVEAASAWREEARVLKEGVELKPGKAVTVGESVSTCESTVLPGAPGCLAARTFRCSECRS